MDDEKVFSPETIPDQPLPEQVDDLQSTASGAATNNETHTPSTIKDSGFPIRHIARETIAASLNTKSKKILGEYTFAGQGAIQIGEYSPGINGDIKISPTGIVARDSAGNNSFFLDGETGDAGFRGTVQANDFQITGGGIIAQATEGQQALGGFDSIQEAINWVNDRGGGSVLIPGGIYQATQHIELFSNIKLIGQDDELTIIDFQGTDKSLIVDEHRNPLRYKNIEINNIQFRNRRQLSSSPRFGAIDIAADKFKIANCKFTDNWNSSTGYGADIYIYDGEGCSIEYCTFDTSGKSIYSGMSKSQIIFNIFKNSASNVISLWSGYSVKIFANVFTDNTGRAITDTGDDDISELMIINNSIKGQKGYGIYLGDSPSTSEDCIIVHNILSSSIASPNSGMGIYGGSLFSKNHIKGNSIIDFNDGDGIKINGGDKNIITDNYIRLNSGYGVNIASGSDYNIIFNNVFDTNAGGGLLNNGTNTQPGGNITF